MSAERKWFQLLLDLVLYETEHTNDGQLLSEGADRLVNRYPILGRVFILVAGGILTLHLANVLPDGWDLMSRKSWQRLLRGK